MIIEGYKKCIDELISNEKIEIISDITNTELSEFSERAYQRRVKSLKNYGIIFNSNNSFAYKLDGISMSWKSKLSLGDIVLKGGFEFNGISDALLFPSDFWKGGVSLTPDAEIPNEYKKLERLGWFQKNPIGLASRTGCFIKQEGQFPFPIAFYSTGGWHTQLGFGYEKYLELLFENYGFLGWQFFYIDINDDIPGLDVTLEEMRVAVKTMPLLFPNKDWSYHKNKYAETLKRLKI